MSARVTLTVYTTDVERAYHGHEADVRIEGVDLLPPPYRRALANQMNAVARSIIAQADADERTAREAGL